MNRNQLVESVKDAAGVGTKEANEAVTAVFETIAGAVAEGDSVAIPGFGTFERRSRSARTGRNPQTGETIEIAAGYSPAFKPAAAFKRQVKEA